MRRAFVVAAFAAAMATAGDVSAQAYFGVPIGDAGFAARAEIGFPEDSKTYDAVLDANLLGPISFQLFGGLWDFDDVDDNGARFGGKIGYALPVAAVSIGPVVGAEYSTISVGEGATEESSSLLVIPVGVGVGANLPLTPAADVVLYAQPAYYYMRTEFEDALGEGDDSVNEFGAEAGARIGVGRFVAGGSVEITTAEGSDAVFALTAGLRF